MVQKRRDLNSIEISQELIQFHRKDIEICKTYFIPNTSGVFKMLKRLQL
jgi:phosphatidylserine/phosphatidylglycerophosphate/cardiolipin synthase-like enzyme